MTCRELFVLDAEVHRRVMGRECRRLVGTDGQPVTDRPFRDTVSGDLVPRYTAKVSAAFGVVTALIGRGAELELKGPLHLGEGWRAYITLSEGGRVIRRGGATDKFAATAICRAALNVMEKQP